MEKIFEDKIAGNVRFVRKSGVKRISIRITPQRGVCVTYPYGVSADAAMTFFLSKRDWVISTVEKMKTVQVVQRSPEELAELKRKASEFLPERLRMLAARYGFSYASLRLKHNKTNWGSCSTLKNINLNISLMALPTLLRDYVMLHELCHLRHHDHSRAFHLLLEHICTDHVIRQMEAGDQAAADVARRAAGNIASSKADFPIERILASEIRRYRP